MQENSENSSEGRENELKLGGDESKNEEGNLVNVSLCRNLNASRWPQQETLALLEIRSDMDVLFREPGLKAHLWEEVSRRMAALGYHRSDKKCREKFENIYKYHKRMKTNSYSRSIGKTYRFFNQLEALDHQQISLQSLSPEQTGTTIKGTAISSTPTSGNVPYVPQMAIPVSVYYDSNPFTTSTSTPSSSGNESERTRKKKRKWANLFDRLMKSVLEKQEELQNKFLEAIDKCEQERLAREEAWKIQESERIRKHRELLMQERSISAAKDAAVLAFLQKISDQGNFSGGELEKIEENSRQELRIVSKKEKDEGENSTSRWPKEEVEALIRIKTTLESQYQRMGPLWEDISMAMKSIGYDRNGKKCKEKWENINKYYRRVKENSKQRSVDSKTCPYFHLLDSLYTVKTKRFDNSLENSGSSLRPEELLMHIMNNNNNNNNNNKGSNKIVAETASVESSQNGDQKHENEGESGNEDANDGIDHQLVPNDPSPTSLQRHEL